MNLAELIAEVVTLSGRPDAATTDIPLHVRAAILKMHQSDFYAKDLAEQEISFASSANIHQFDTSNLPRYRNIKYLRQWDPTGIDPFTNLPSGRAGQLFTILDPEAILDRYALERTDILYVAGTTVNVRALTAFRYALCGWYQNPVITADGFSSWIAEQVPYAIVFEAASAYFKSIGYDEQSTAMRALVADQLAIVKMQGLQAHGY